MPYQLIIHYDDGRQEVVASGTQTDIINAMSNTKIDPEQALWEMVWVAPQTEINGIQYSSQMGQVKRDNGETPADWDV